MNAEKMEEKLERLAQIARLYYEQDKTQNEIASLYGISRPMVSKLLKEARDSKIVTITISIPGCLSAKTSPLEQAGRQFGISGGVAVHDGEKDQETNQAIADAAISYLAALGENRLGIGWGHIIGDLVSAIERREGRVAVAGRLCPLIGNGSMGLKNYHSNELVRTMAEKSGAKADFLYSPACVLSGQERKLTTELESYRVVYEAWEKLDVALVNIGNFPSVPDFASEARFGDLLVTQKAAGRILNYFVDEQGRVLQSDMDYAIQIPLNLLARVKFVIGICSANTKARALKGALRSGYINHIIAPASVLRDALELPKNGHI